MAKIDQDLIPGENVIRKMRPHWALLAKPFFIMIHLSVVLFFAHKGLSKGLPHRSPAIDQVLLGVYVAFLLVWAGVPFLRWFTTKYIFTDKRIMTRVGILRIEGETIPLVKINNLTYKRSLLERLYGSGSLVIEAASKGEIVIRHVRGAENIQKQIYEYMSVKE